MTNKKHSHYYKDVSALKTIDVYRVLDLFNVTNPCIQHAVKKLLVAGGRGAGKDIGKDIQESIDSLERWKEMQTEGKSVFAECAVSAIKPYEIRPFTFTKPAQDKSNNYLNGYCTGRTDLLKEQAAPQAQSVTKLMDALEMIVSTHQGHCEHHVGVSEHSYNLADIAEEALSKYKGAK